MKSPGITLIRNLLRRIPVCLRKGDTYLYRLNEFSTFHEPYEGVGRQILNRPELAVAARIFGIAPETHGRIIRTGDDPAMAGTLISQRTGRSDTHDMNLLDVIRSALGLKLLDDDRKNDLYRTPISMKDARTLYKLVPDKPRFWRGFQSIDEIRNAQHALGQENVIEAIILLDPECRGSMWLALDDLGARSILLNKLDAMGSRELLAVCLLQLWEDQEVREKLATHFRDVIGDREKILEFFNLTNLAMPIGKAYLCDFINRKTDEEIKNNLLDLNNDDPFEILKQVLSYAYSMRVNK